MLPFLFAGFLTACTPMEWVRDDVTADEAQVDAELCREQAWREASWRPLHYGNYGPWVYRDPFGRRYLAWQPSHFGNPLHERFMEESRLADFCMRAKGYELAPVER